MPRRTSTVTTFQFSGFSIHVTYLSFLILPCRFGTGTLTRVFIQRVFEECMTYEKEMDYKTYLDFVLAMDNKREPQALQYFFRLLDVGHRNHLNTFDLHFYFKV